jgi:hypothetical protein
MHSVAVPINVRCYSNSDIILRRSEVTLRASFYRKRLESAHLAIFVDVSDQFILRGAFGFFFCRGAEPDTRELENILSHRSLWLSFLNVERRLLAISPAR